MGYRLLWRASAMTVAAVGSAGTLGVFKNQKDQYCIRTHIPVHVKCEASANINDGKDNSSSTGERFFKRSEVEAHTTADTGIWVTFEDGVYDITDFVANHPGGQEKIMLAAGQAIDPFWRIYQAHLTSSLAKESLKSMRLGLLDPSEPPTVVDTSDPYSLDPARHPGLLFHNNKPCNAELPPSLQTENWITPNALFFIRHHHPVPVIDPVAFRLSFHGVGVRPIALTMEDLKERFPKTTVVSTVQCGGNRRAELDAISPTAGIGWGTGAVSNAQWGGVLLRDVLVYSGLLTPEVAQSLGAHHIVFKAADGLEASIPIDKALAVFGDTLLAYEMNGEQLPAEHGGPIRLIVPGHVGIRNVKWVTQVISSTEEAMGPWQRGIAYKGFSPNVSDFSSVDVESILSIQEMPVQSVVVSPEPNSVVAIDGDDDTIVLSGWAWSGGGRGIVRVDISSDGGETWTTATLTDGSEQHPYRAWAWTFWEGEVAVPKNARTGGAVTLLCRATDSSYNVQPERVESIWNKRGLNNTAWHRVHINVKLEK
eukprot:m.123014 g.123014  ORF g.123014 m.123014 type:complete len:538 (+) comp28955_c0_seq1:89-1702(+)